MIVFDGMSQDVEGIYDPWVRNLGIAILMPFPANHAFARVFNLIASKSVPNEHQGAT
jgi:hypothetical protein